MDLVLRKGSLLTKYYQEKNERYVRLRYLLINAVWRGKHPLVSYQWPATPDHAFLFVTKTHLIKHKKYIAKKV